MDKQANKNDRDRQAERQTDKEARKNDIHTYIQTDSQFLRRYKTNLIIAKDRQTKIKDRQA